MTRIINEKFNKKRSSIAKVVKLFVAVQGFNLPRIKFLRCEEFWVENFMRLEFSKQEWNHPPG